MTRYSTLLTPAQAGGSPFEERGPAQAYILTPFHVENPLRHPFPPATRFLRAVITYIRRERLLAGDTRLGGTQLGALIRHPLAHKYAPAFKLSSQACDNLFTDLFQYSPPRLAAMFVFIRFVTLLGAISTLAAATPVPNNSPRTIGAVVCSLPIISRLCRKDTGEVDVLTLVGMARGLQTTSTSSRFAVRYATASRWGLPAKANSWVIPGGDINKLPPLCPQNGVDPSQYSEDCLQLVIYTPVPNPSILTSVPVFVWIHGGSFKEGGASKPGLDGASFAKATNSIVVVVQYRLGILGFVPPSSSNNPNLAVQDVITALQFIRQTIPSFGGDINQITVAGQSSGGQMVRALLATPSASSLFKYAAIHSDPMDYGFYKPETIAEMQTYIYNTNPGPLAACNGVVACQKGVAVTDVLSTQNSFLGDAAGLWPVTSGASVFRPYHDGQLLQYTLTGNSFPPTASMKPTLVLTVKDEAGSTIGDTDYFPTPVPEYVFAPTIQGVFDPNRSNTLVASDNYTPASYSSQAGVDPGDETRAALTQLVTDYVWRCASWTFSRNWASKGATVFTGEIQVGATYPSNSGISYCTSGGRVCHEDDIYILFGTTPSPTSAQTALTQEIQARYSAFMRTGYPNPASGGYASWSQSTTSDVKALKLGGTGTRSAEACDPSFWGATVPYDYQLFGL